MSRMTVSKEKCVGCGICIRACPAGTISMVDRKAVIGGECTSCGMCLESCPRNAINAEVETLGAIGGHSGVWVFVEQNAGIVRTVGLELIGEGRKLADSRGCKLEAVLIGCGVAAQSELVIRNGADIVYLADSPALAVCREDAYSALIVGLVKEHKPEIMLFGATAFGRSLAPRVASMLDLGLTADCTELRIDGGTGLLEQTRPAFGGNLMATIVSPVTRPQMATVRPGVMLQPSEDPSRRGYILPVDPAYAKRQAVEILDTLRNASDTIADAKLIVSAGRGIGSEKNMALVKRLASALGGAYGVSRPLVDAGWAEYKHQIGQTGCSVAPDILIAFGISGAIQHLAGIGNAKTVIAVNRDPQAPIFKAANYGVVGDCVEMMKLLLARLE